MDWVIMRKLEVNFVKDLTTRRYSILQPIARPILSKFMDLTALAVERHIADNTDIQTTVRDEVSHSHLNAGEAVGERISNTHSLHLNNSAYESIITNIRSLHFNEFGVRMQNYHSLVPSHEN